ncbi:MAG TPA: iron ABC transporter permease [Candidatus Aminicenantes bacterium]|nr:iron ABC transporter permease [Candidatus Aminicenantes bacterium]
MKTKLRARLIIWLAILLPLFLLFFSLSLGTYPISLSQVLKTIAAPFFSSLEVPQSLSAIIFHIRLPRLLLALLIGASLSVSGASLQAIFKNPLINEYILGLSSGAAFGAALSLVFLGQNFPPQLAAFIFGVLAVGGVLIIAGQSETHLITLILTGVIMTAFFSALLSLVEFFASPYALQSLFFWLMGNLSLATWKDILLAGPLMVLGVVILTLLRWRMNVLSMGDEQVKALGINLRREKIIVILAATLATAAATSVAGIIGWVGLIVPHLVRMAIGPDNRWIIPLSASVGGGFLILADDLTRTIAAFEIPIGIFTSLVGIPLFIVLLKKTQRVWL